jgi:proton-translocating NADH-quinone oxidoreductase chain M
MWLMLGFHGSRNRKIEAQSAFFMYTLMGSLLLLSAIIVLILQTGSSNLLILTSHILSPELQMPCFIAFFIALAIKMPMVPFHVWLPQAHTEAPTGGSVILAAILLKLGTYGFLRFCIPLFPDASAYFAPLVIALAVIGVIYSSISACALLDLKQIIAYSSIAHMNISVIGLFSGTLQGLTGAYLYSISHGFVSAGLFLLVGVLYDRYHTRTLKYFRGLVLIMPIYTVLLFLFTLANLSFPGTLSFLAEISIFMSAAAFNPFVLLISSLASIFLPIYLIWTYHKISYGSLSVHLGILAQDITLREFHLIAP